MVQWSKLNSPYPAFDYFCQAGNGFYPIALPIAMNKTNSSLSQSSLRGFLVLALLMGSLLLKGENLQQILDLQGNWKFTVGDDPAWAEPEYNDSKWDYVRVPRSWESEGFIDYNGFAWYRKEFQLTGKYTKESLFLILGYIDDVDEVYINGKRVGGTGIMPPRIITAHRVLRKYPLPLELLNPSGNNVIAVRVFDEYREGGIYSGPVGIFYDKDIELLSLNLAGYWDFEPQFEIEHNADAYYNQDSGKIYVPGYWESYGYAAFDGSATYTTTFAIPGSTDIQNLMVVLGYIDDIDKVYLNGVKIGSVESAENKDKRPNELVLRGYPIPAGLLKAEGQNILKVKVYDTGGLGGIYEGPVGLIRNENFSKLNRVQHESPDYFWEDFFNNLFKWD